MSLPQFPYSGLCDESRIDLAGLRGILQGFKYLMYVDHIDRTGTDFYRVAREQDLEGIVAKLKTGLYTPEATS